MNCFLNWPGGSSMLLLPASARHVCGRTIQAAMRKSILLKASVEMDQVLTKRESIGMVMQDFDMHSLSEEQLMSLTLRPKIDFSTTMELVTPIVSEVQRKGDDAVREFSKKFDKADLSQIVVDPNTLAAPVMDDSIRTAFDVAYDNIRKFHIAQAREELIVSPMDGVECRRVSRPIERVGLYVPGGTAVLPSTAMMLGVPAQLAGCTEIVLATPPRPDGSVCPEVLYAARKCGVTKILKAGGAQAIAAMAFGTDSCPKVDKICGPGNQFVTAAKMMLQNSGEASVAIDMPAGPSEQLCIADSTSNPSFVVSDLLSQAEHGVDSQVVCVALDGFDENRFAEELKVQLEALPRKEIAEVALSKSVFLRVRDFEEAVRFTNLYAPEHLVIAVDDPEVYVEKVINAGSIFLGHYTPESVGDYASGTNHSLPTYGYARMYGGVSLDTFVKYITIQKLTPQGLLNVGPHVETMAAVEELHAHKNAVTLRLSHLQQS